ncbi:MAG: carboxyl transferase domain-containing protein, partial [Candidatus Rokuibacteriota bacterium]
MSWEPEIDELKRRLELARRMGGPENVERQHKAGRLTVRERVDGLLDAGSFHETGGLAGKATYADGDLESFLPANCVLGAGRIGGRRVVVCGDDFTVRGGAADAAIHAKQVYGERMARELRLPIVRLVDGTGGGGSVKTYEQTGRTYVPGNPGWDLIVAMMSEVPVVAAALGPTAGLGAARVAHAHFSLMVRGVSQVFVAGPPVVERAFGTPVGKEELGGVEIHGGNGTVDNVVDSEAEAFDQICRFLGYLPSNVWQLPPRSAPEDDPGRRDEALLSFMPRNRRRGYDPRTLVGHVVDRGSFFEIGRTWGGSLVTGLARLHGYPVGVLASDPKHAGGALTADGSEKLTRFADLCDTFHLPVVHFVDQPGFLIGTPAERASTIRKGVRALAAVYPATVPWVSSIGRRVFGVAGAGHGNVQALNLRYAWPSGDWGSLPLEGGIEAAYK